MWWWRKVRRANISRELRDRFEEYGVQAMTMAISASGANIYAQGAEIVTLVQEKRGQISMWLREKADLAARREDRLETVEWAILIFAMAGVLTDALVFVHDMGWLKSN